MDPSIAGVRAGITEAWKGTAGKVAVRDFVLGRCKRKVTRFERLYATGTGTEAAPGLLVIEGELDAPTVALARSS